MSTTWLVREQDVLTVRSRVGLPSLGEADERRLSLWRLKPLTMRKRRLTRALRRASRYFASSGECGCSARSSQLGEPGRGGSRVSP